MDEELYGMAVASLVELGLPEDEAIMQVEDYYGL